MGTIALALPGSASAAVTFGSDLEDPISGGTLPSDTFVVRTLDADDRAGGGATAPARGVITQWRAKVLAAAGGSVRLRVLRGHTSVYRGMAVSFPGVSVERTYSFGERVSVRAGDRIGIDQVSDVGLSNLAAGGSSDAWFDPILGFTETRAPSSRIAAQLLINADLEPDADRDGYGDQTQDRCPRDASTQRACASTQ